MINKSYVTYGEAFKRQVVDEIQSGRFRSAREASRVYGIKGKSTVSGWLRKYGREEFIPKRVTITTMSEQDENKQLKKQVKELEQALAHSYMSNLLNESFLEQACKRLGLDVDEFKKKHVTRLPQTPPKKGGNKTGSQ